MKKMMLVVTCLVASLLHGAEVDVPVHEFEYTDAMNTVETYQLSLVNITNGYIKGWATGIDPQIKIMDIASTYDEIFPASLYTKVEIRMFIDAQAVGDAYFFWGTSDANNFSIQRSIQFSTTKGMWKTYILDLSTHPGWTGLIDDIRIDPFAQGNYNKAVYIDSIRLITETPGLSTTTPVKMNILWRKTAGTSDQTTVNTINGVSGTHHGQILYTADSTLSSTVPLYRHYKSTTPVDHLDALEFAVPGICQ